MKFGMGAEGTEADGGGGGRREASIQASELPITEKYLCVARGCCQATASEFPIISHENEVLVAAERATAVDAFPAGESINTPT